MKPHQAPKVRNSKTTGSVPPTPSELFIRTDRLHQAIAQQRAFNTLTENTVFNRESISSPEFEYGWTLLKSSVEKELQAAFADLLKETRAINLGGAK